MKKIITLLILITLLSCDISDSYPTAEWTLIFYLADDYDSIPLSFDVDELTEYENTSRDLRLVFLYDGQIAGDSKLHILDSPFSDNSREISLSSAGLTTDNDGDLDMSDSETLKTYIEYAKATFPADNYALYVGAHGTGYTNSNPSGIAVENGTTNDEIFLTINEMADAVEDAGGVDLLTFDVCNIGNIENIYEFRNAADYIMASPELIPGAGNDYESFVEAAFSLTEVTALSLGEKALEVYFNAYDEDQLNENDFEQRSLQQLYDTGKITAIVESDEFTAEIITFLDYKDGSDNTFNNGNYTDIYGLFSGGYDLSDLNDAITIADGGLYKWISIYTPSTYNSEYDTTAFATLHESWVAEINP